MGEKYLQFSDEELIRMYREGDVEVMDYLLEKYKNLVLMPQVICYGFDVAEF